MLEALHYPISRLIKKYNATVIQTLCSGRKIDIYISGTEWRVQKHRHIDGQLIFYKDARVIQP